MATVKVFLDLVRDQVNKGIYVWGARWQDEPYSAKRSEVLVTNIRWEGMQNVN